MKKSALNMALALLLGCFPLFNCGTESDESGDDSTNITDGKGDFDNYGEWGSTAQDFLKPGAGELATKCKGGYFKGEISDTTNNPCKGGCAAGTVCTIIKRSWATIDTINVEACCQTENPNTVKLGSSGSSKPVVKLGKY